jgi:hypothetical protein
MLREFEGLRQEEGGFRRLLFNDSYDLYIWYDRREGEILGFQLVYMAGPEQKALTWEHERGFSHAEVEGWDSSRFNRTPILVRDGAFDGERIEPDIARELEAADPAIAELVLRKIREYRELSGEPGPR